MNFCKQSWSDLKWLRSPSWSLALAEGMSMLRSKNGSCFFEDVLQERQVTSDCRVPPKIHVTKDCVDALPISLDRLFCKDHSKYA